jgi:hypothetical protein
MNTILHGSPKAAGAELGRRSTLCCVKASINNLSKLAGFSEHFWTTSQDRVDDFDHQK